MYGGVSYLCVGVCLSVYPFHFILQILHFSKPLHRGKSKELVKNKNKNIVKRRKLSVLSIINLWLPGEDEKLLLTYPLLNWEKSQFFLLTRSLLAECVSNTDLLLFSTCTLRENLEYPWELTGKFQKFSFKALALERSSFFCKIIFSVKLLFNDLIEQPLP